MEILLEYHKNGEFIDGRIKNESTVEFSMLWTEEGSTYNAGVCSIEILDDSTLKFKVMEDISTTSGTGKK